LNFFGAVFWVDASFRALEPVDKWNDVFHLAMHNKGMVLVTPPNKVYSIYAFTDPVMFNFLPTDTERQKAVGQACSCAMLIYNTEFIYKHVLHWMYLCTLETSCCPPITPITKIFHDFTHDEVRNTTLYKESRWDQSMANLVLSNLWGYHTNRYSSSFGEPHHIIYRYADQTYNITTCS
jgi:hypothetical protein